MTFPYETTELDRAIGVMRDAADAPGRPIYGRTGVSLADLERATLQMADAPQKMSPLDQAFDRLGQTTEGLRARIEQLEKRLAPLLCHRPQNEVVDKVGVLAPSSDLVMRLNGGEHLLGDLCGRLDYLLDNLDC